MQIPECAAFDIETKSIGDPYEIECATLAIIDTNGEFYYFWGDDIYDGVALLNKYSLITGFNSRAFDVPCLLKYCTRAEGRKLRYKPHFDLFHEWRKKYKTNMSLKNFAKNTLNLDKFENTNNGPVDMWENGDMDTLMQYNRWDTLMTLGLYLFVVQNGYVLAKMGMGLRRFTPETITRIA